MENGPVRKTNRLEQYDYSSPGYYFITVCTRERKPILGQVTKSDETRQATVLLSSLGTLTEQALLRISTVYPGVSVEKYVIMPNHFHVILAFSSNASNLPNLSRVIQQTKRRVSKEAGVPVWQAHFYEHVIRNESDFQETWKYIDNNPTKWSMDQYYHEG